MRKAKKQKREYHCNRCNLSFINTTGICPECDDSLLVISQEEYNRGKRKYGSFYY